RRKSKVSPLKMTWAAPSPSSSLGSASPPAKMSSAPPLPRCRSLRITVSAMALAPLAGLFVKVEPHRPVAGIDEPQRVHPREQLATHGEKGLAQRTPFEKFPQQRDAEWAREDVEDFDLGGDHRAGAQVLQLGEKRADALGDQRRFLFAVGGVAAVQDHQ